MEELSQVRLSDFRKVLTPEAVRGFRLAQLAFALLLLALPLLAWFLDGQFPRPGAQPDLLPLQLVTMAGLLATVVMPFAGNVLFRKLLASRQLRRNPPGWESADAATRCLMLIRAAFFMRLGMLDTGPIIAVGALMLAAVYGVLASGPHYFWINAVPPVAVGFYMLLKLPDREWIEAVFSERISAKL